LAAPFRETGTFIPSELDPNQTAQVLEAAGDAIKALGVQIGCLHTEIKLTPDGPRILEVNGRVGGGVPEMLLLAAGLDILALSMRVALGQPVHIEDMVACSKVGYRLMYQPPASAGVVISIEGLDQLPQFPGLHRLAIKHGPGDAFDIAEGTSVFLFDAVGSVDDHRGLLDVVRRVYDTVSVTYGKAAP
jgi:biotin carboxylase